MNAIEHEETTARSASQDHVIQFPHGLLGFEHIKRYALIKNAEEEPFVWLQMLDDPSFSFLMAPPLIILPTYQPVLNRQDLALLKIEAPEDSLMFSIVTLQADGKGTANLKGPIVINHRLGIGGQLVLTNAGDYDVAHPLPVANDAS